MKNTNLCPKCNSHDIIRIEGKHYGNGAGNIIFIGLSALKAVKVTRYVCTKCGYTEEWIDNQEDIQKLIKKFK